MTRTIALLVVFCIVTVALAVVWFNEREEESIAARNVEQVQIKGSSRPPSLEANALICPIREDFPEELPEGIWLPPRCPEKLGPLHPDSRGRLVEAEGALGGGRGSGPLMGGGVNNPQRLSKWYSSIRYIVYNTPEAARASAFRERYLLFGTAARPRRGSFSGAEIGDLCGRMSSRSSYALHFVRDCVSVEIWASVRDPYRDEPLQELIENVLEMTAKAIVKRIDGIVAAKGKVGMTNLPPIGPWTPSLETNALICPIMEDFHEELPEGISMPPRRTEELRSLHPNARLEEVEGALGGGRGGGPSMGAANVPQHPSKWYSSIRYIVYKTPEAARANAFKETILLMASIPRRGSFSGAEIGDLCGRKSSPFSHTLHFVRDCVSVEIWAHVRDSYHYDEPLQELIQNVLEMTAKVIVKRVDGIVATKGKVDMTNLPPIRPRTVDEGG